MPNVPKTFIVHRKPFNSLQDAQTAYDELVRQLDFMFRQIRADLEKAEARLTTLEP